jgi:predicted HTH domain antitoxin
MTVQIPDDIASALRLPEAEQQERVILELACGLYAAGLLAAGKAAQLAGKSRLAFGEELTRRNISRHYTAQDLATDLAYAGI